MYLGPDYNLKKDTVEQFNEKNKISAWVVARQIFLSRVGFFEGN